MEKDPEFFKNQAVKGFIREAGGGSVLKACRGCHWVLGFSI